MDVQHKVHQSWGMRWVLHGYFSFSFQAISIHSKYADESTQTGFWHAFPPVIRRGMGVA
jgi:hypothetical protein